MSNGDELNWMDEEDNRAGKNLNENKTENDQAPRMKKVNIMPKRTTKGVYVTESIWGDFETVIFNQKKIKGKSKPELAEEALLFIINKYGLN